MSVAHKVDREPCPYRIVDDAGGAFVFGLIGGTVWHTVGGWRNAPRGQAMAQAISRTRARVPMLGGSFAVWGTLFSCCDCTFTYIRRKEDAWNAILSGAATGGILAIRAGPKAAGKSALVGGVILAAIEGLNLLIMRVIMPRIEESQAKAGAPVDMLVPPEDPWRKRRRQFGAGPATFDNGGFAIDSGNKRAAGFDIDALLSTESSASTASSTTTSNWGKLEESTLQQDEEQPKKAWYQLW